MSNIFNKFLVIDHKTKEPQNLFDIALWLHDSSSFHFLKVGVLYFLHLGYGLNTGFL